MTKQKEEHQNSSGKIKGENCNEARKTQEQKGKSPKELEQLKEKIGTLQGDIEELNKKLTAEKDDYIRLMAEFETFRRRTAEDRLSLIDSAAADTVKGLLPVLDDCERAIELLKESGDDAAKEGTALIYNKLMAYLKTKGLEVIEAVGKKFDTDFHEAVARIPVEDEEKKGLVYDVVSTGYTFKGKILRYAKVVVGI